MITSTTNSQMKNIVQLNKKARTRRELCVFVVEGMKMFLETPEELLKKIYLSQTMFRELREEDRLDYVLCTDYEIVDDEVFKKISDTTTPQGILCVVKMPVYEFEDLLQGENTHILVLEGIQDPGNLGTMFRTAEGAGATGIIMNQETADLFQPKTVRATMGSIYRMPFYITQDLPDAVERLHKAGVHTYAAHLGGEVSYDEPDYTKATAFFVGNEGNGLSDETARLAEQYLKIPMGGQLESLNAAMAAGILMYEVNRQRRK